MIREIYRSGLYELLKIFYENKEHAINFNKIVQLSNLGKSSVDRYLKILVKNKILLVEKEANLIKYGLNYKNPISISLLIISSILLLISIVIKFCVSNP